MNFDFFIKLIIILAIKIFFKFLLHIFLRIYFIWLGEILEIKLILIIFIRQKFRK